MLKRLAVFLLSLAAFTAQAAPEIGHVLVTSATDQTNATTTWTTPTGFEITGAALDANSTYLLLVSAIISGNLTTVDLYEFRTFDAKAAGQLGESYARLKPRIADARSGYPYLFMTQVTTDASPTGDDYEFQFRVNTGTDTAQIADFYMLAIKTDDITASDFKYNDHTTDINDPVTWTDGASVTLGDGSSNWLVISTMKCVPDLATADSCMGRLSVDAVTRNGIRDEHIDLDENFVMGWASYLAAPASSIVVKNQVQSFSGNWDITNNTIFALRLDAFEDHNGVWDTTSVPITGFDTDFITATSAFTTVTVATENWLWLGDQHYSVGTGGEQMSYRLNDSTRGLIAGSTNTEYVENRDNAADQRHVFWGEDASVANSTAYDVDHIVQENTGVTPQPVVDETVVVAFTWELATGGGGAVPITVDHARRRTQ